MLCFSSPLADSKCASNFISFSSMRCMASTCSWQLDLSNPIVFSPPARWGLLDFMSVDFRRLLPPSAAFRLLRTSTTTIHAKCRESTPSVPCRTSTARIHASVPCRTSTATIHAQCSLPDLNRDHPRPVFPAGPQPRESTPSVPCRTSTAGENAKRYARSNAR